MLRKPRPLSKRDVHLIQASCALVTQQATMTAARFYAHLFRLDPSLRRLFHGGMIEQGKKFIDMLALVAARLDHVDELLPTVRELGVRHAGYHVEESHYPTAREALLAALADVLGGEFSTATRGAWTRAYDLLAKTMIDAARGVNPAAPR